MRQNKQIEEKEAKKKAQETDIADQIVLERC